MIPKMMAVRITEKTYPIAFACLPLSFAELVPQKILDKYFLVINSQLLSTGPPLFGRTKTISFTNLYLPPKEFENRFERITEHIILMPHEFFEIRPK